MCIFLFTAWDAWLREKRQAAAGGPPAPTGQVSADGGYGGPGGVARLVAEPAERLLGLRRFLSSVNRRAAAEPALKLAGVGVGELQVAGYAPLIAERCVGDQPQPVVLAIEALDGEPGERQLVGQERRDGLGGLLDIRVPADFLPGTEQG